MDKEIALKYYSKPEIEKAILNFAKDREIGVMFNGYFGKRPDVIENLYDIRKLVKKGVFSFHCSEERWANPLLLGNNKQTEEEKEKNKIGWDLILDLDGVNFIYSKFLAKVIIDYLENMGIQNLSIKFSGNKGFHLAIPFESFSSECPGLVSGISQTRLLFPDVAKKTVMFLLHELKNPISRIILDYEGGGIKAIEKISNLYKIKKEELNYNEKNYEFNFMKVIDIDTILITSRHLFRMPYSLNEKSGLVSIPVNKKHILDFERFLAKPEKVNPEKYQKYEFLKYDENQGQDANTLLQKVYSDLDYMYDSMYTEFENDMKNKSKGEFILEINEKIEIKDFPNTIQYIIKTNFDDGRKRALFLLLTFLHLIKWEEKNIEEIIKDWNNKQNEPLKQNYIQAQLSWFKIQQKTLTPPNFNNDNYYQGIGIPKEIIEKDINSFKTKIKNPQHYIFLYLKNKPTKNKNN